MTQPIHDERRTAPAVREYRNNGLGPTAQWLAAQDHAAEQEQLTVLLWREGWSVVDIAGYLGVGITTTRQRVDALVDST